MYASCIVCVCVCLLLDEWLRSIEFAIRKIHFGMLFHEFLQHILLLLFVARRQSHLFLSLVVHHLLDEAAGFALQVGQLRRFGVDLLRRDRRVGRDKTIPPRHLVQFFKRQHDRVVFDDPDRVLFLDLIAERCVDDGRLVFEAELQVFLVELDDNVAGANGERGIKGNFKLGENHISKANIHIIKKNFYKLSKQSYHGMYPNWRLSQSTSYLWCKHNQQLCQTTQWLVTTSAQTPFQHSHQAVCTHKQQLYAKKMKSKHCKSTRKKWIRSREHFLSTSPPNQIQSPQRNKMNTGDTL